MSITTLTLLIHFRSAIVLTLPPKLGGSSYPAPWLLRNGFCRYGLLASSSCQAIWHHYGDLFHCRFLHLHIYFLLIPPQLHLISPTHPDKCASGNLFGTNTFIGKFLANCALGDLSATNRNSLNYSSMTPSSIGGSFSRSHDIIGLVDHPAIRAASAQLCTQWVVLLIQ